MRRIYQPFSAYLVTTNPKGRYPYFKYSALCRLFTSVLKTSEYRKDFRTIGYKLNPDHIHILLQVRSKYNISEVVHNIKRVSSIAFNKLLDFTDSAIQDKIPENEMMLNQLKQDFVQEVGSERFEIPLFKWGKDFDDRLIRSKNQLTRAISYLKKQSKKHDLTEDCWLCINDIPCDIRFDSKRP